MLVISYIRDHREEVIERLSIKNFTNVALIDEILKLDDERRATKKQCDETLAALNNNARVIGDYLMEGIRNIGSSHIKEVRGRGLMIGIELDMPHKMVRKPLIKHEHCFTGADGQNILRLLPPLCLTKADADDFI